MGLIIFILFIIIVRRTWSDTLRERELRGSMVRRCRVCERDIPYGASKCPYCHSKPGSDFIADVNTAGDRFSLFCAKVFRLILFLIILAILVSML